MNKCLNCARFPFCKNCNDLQDADKECFKKRNLESVIRKEEYYESRIKSKI